MMLTDDTPHNFYVYAILRLDNGLPCYIGKGQGRRWTRHQSAGAKHRNKHLASILTKTEVAVVMVREGLTEAEAFATEIALIAAIGRNANGPLANQTDGGDGSSGARDSDETRAKKGAASRAWVRGPEVGASISAAKKGHQVSAATRAKIGATQKAFDADKRAAISAKVSVKLKGFPQSAESRAKRSAALQTPEAKLRLSAAAKGKPVPMERRAKISAAMKGKPKSAETKANMSLAAQREMERRAPQYAAMRGVPRSPEVRAKISAGHRARLLKIT